jgi:hypothetical protein
MKKMLVFAALCAALSGCDEHWERQELPEATEEIATVEKLEHVPSSLVPKIGIDFNGEPTFELSHIPEQWLVTVKKSDGEALVRDDKELFQKVAEGESVILSYRETFSLHFKKNEAGEPVLVERTLLRRELLGVRPENHRV